MLGMLDARRRFPTSRLAAFRHPATGAHVQGRVVSR
jgi:hypothetical protein